MLVLTRRIGEELVIEGPATIRLVSCKGNSARIGVVADGDTKVYRKELIGRANGSSEKKETDEQ